MSHFLKSIGFYSVVATSYSNLNKYVFVLFSWVKISSDFDQRQPHFQHSHRSDTRLFWWLLSFWPFVKRILAFCRSKSCFEVWCTFLKTSWNFLYLSSKCDGILYFQNHSWIRQNLRPKHESPLVSPFPRRIDPQPHFTPLLEATAQMGFYPFTFFKMIL